MYWGRLKWCRVLNVVLVLFNYRGIFGYLFFMEKLFWIKYIYSWEFLMKLD